MNRVESSTGRHRRRGGYLSVRALAAIATWLALTAVIVVGVSIHRGRPSLPERRQGVISLSPALTDLLFELGAGEQVAGISDYTRLPEGVSRPVVGDAMRLDREMVVRMRPRAIVTQQRPTELIEQLSAEQGVRVIYVPIEDLATLRQAIGSLAELTGSGRADALIGRINAELAGVREQVADRPRPRVLLAINRDPVMAIGQGTFLSELVEIAGGRNAVEQGRYPTLNDEDVSSRIAPEVIIDVAVELDGAPASLIESRRASWRTVEAPAVPERVVVLTDPRLTIPGAHVGQVARTLAEVIHPDAFSPSPRRGPAGSASPAATRPDAPPPARGQDQSTRPGQGGPPADRPATQREGVAP